MKKSQLDSSFFQFLRKKEQGVELGIFFLILLIIFILFHHFFPYFWGTTDSGNYIVSAINGRHNGYRPLGYSNFLAFIHGISPSYYFFYFVQFWLTAISSLFFILSVKYLVFSKLAKTSLTTVAYYVLAFFALTSPSLIFCTKYVMSEAYFNLLTLVFLTSSLWLLFGRNWFMLGLHLISLYLLMTTRYVGMMYPIISFIVALMIFKERKYFGLLILLCSVLVGILSYINTKAQMKEAFNVDTYSAFGGWASANNALVLMPEMKQTAPSEIKDLKARYVHEEMIKIPDSLFNNERLLATSYMWDRENSLKNVLFRYINEYQTPYYKAWVLVGSYMDAYGKYWKRKMPVEFAKRYYTLNITNVFQYFSIEKFAGFHTDQTAIGFFELSKEKDQQVKYPTFFEKIDPLQKIGHYLLWILTAFALIIWAWKHKWFPIYQHKIFAVIALFCVAYIGASVVGHPINNFRYFLPIYIPNLFFVITVFALLLNRWFSKAKTAQKVG